MDKDQIIEAVRTLRDSAVNRKTEQGMLVYTKTLEILAAAKTVEQVEEIRTKLNHALFGIEAHGYLTKDEFEVVCRLRQ